jgi:hypothetical protein
LRVVLKFVSTPKQKNSLYYSSTFITKRTDIIEEIALYINETDLFFIILEDVNIESSLQKKLIPFNDKRFNLALDSIKFGKNKYGDGIYLERMNLRVFEVKRRFLCENTFVIRSRNYIPYLSAPEMFIPLKKVSDGYMSTEIADSYYEGYGKLRKLNQKYYEDLKPGKKIILRMKKR